VSREGTPGAASPSKQRLRPVLLVVLVVALGGCRSARKDLDACRAAADCVLVREDECCNPSSCDELISAETPARGVERRSACARKDCQPAPPRLCSHGATFTAECRAGRCIATATPTLSGAWRVTAFHRGDSVSRDPRATLTVSFDGADCTWSGETTSELTTTTGVKAVTTPWSAKGTVSREADVLTITWPEGTPQGPAADALSAWTTRAGQTSQVRVDQRGAVLFLHRLDLDASLELSLPLPADAGRGPG